MIEIAQLTKTYGTGENATVVLDRLDFSVRAGEILAVVGPSGAGKSTLAECINLLTRPTSGSVIVNGDDLTSLNAKQLRVARRRIGTVFQSSSLLSRRTVAENVALPLDFLGATKSETARRVGELLDRVGLSDKAARYPFQLSGGQRQRVGIARALALRPSVLLSDEATSGLDPQTTESVVELLRELRQDLDLAIVFITHEMDTVLRAADSVARLDHGRIVESGKLVDLLTDHRSRLGNELRPRRDDAQAAAGDVQWNVTYDSPAVPQDWIGRLGQDLGAPVALLGASVQVVAGVAVGSASIGIGGHLSARVPDALTALGLSGSANAEQPILEVAS